MDHLELQQALLTGQRFAVETSAGVASLAGSCGGAAAPERVDLYRLTSTALAALEVRLTGLDFAPAVYALFGGCDIEGERHVVPHRVAGSLDHRSVTEWDLHRSGRTDRWRGRGRPVSRRRG